MDDKMVILMDTADCNKENETCIDALEIKKKILPFCRSQKERWKEAFLKLVDEDPNAQYKTILKGIIKDIIEEPDKEKARQISEQEFGETARPSAWEDDIDIYAQYFSNTNELSQFKISKKKLSILLKRARGTIRNWYEGEELPKYRDDVIKLAFWAKSTIEETNKLLECAGKRKLYVKGSGDTKDNSNSLVDTVYIHMLRNENYSFAKAEKLIKEMNRAIQEKIKAQNEDSVITLKNETSSDSENMEKLLEKVGNDDTEFLTFIQQHIDSFIYDYQALYDMLYLAFEKEYDVNNKNVQEHRDSDKCSLNSLLGISLGSKRRWKNSLVKIIYTAIPQKTKQTQLTDTDYHTISRKDLIVLGLILNMDLAGVNMLLDTCKEPPIYGRGIGECIIWNALKTGAELVVDEFPEEAGELYKSECIYTVFKKALEKNTNIRNKSGEITEEKIVECLNKQLKEYETLYYEYEYNMPISVTQRKKNREQINKEYVRKFPCCNALHSLKVFEWIKATAAEMKLSIVMESIQDILELYPEKQLFDYIVNFMAQEMGGSNS